MCMKWITGWRLILTNLRNLLSVVQLPKRICIAQLFFFLNRIIFHSHLDEKPGERNKKHFVKDYIKKLHKIWEEDNL